MSELENLIWVEKYRPKTFDDLICDHKEKILKYAKNLKQMPSFIFYSPRPGTGKTTAARLFAKLINADLLQVNASDERGIDVIRDKIKHFAQSMSMTPNVKRCIFLDEADGLTKQAQESMKSLMETYSKNCFFILSCNDLAKIIEPIRVGRCKSFNFSCPNKNFIIDRLVEIAKCEELDVTHEEIKNLVISNYPDIRSMILTLQDSKIDDSKILVNINQFNDFLTAMHKKDINFVYQAVYSSKFDMQGFVRYFFRRIFDKSKTMQIERLAKIALLLADIEKSWTIGVTYEIVFLSNIVEIMRIT